MRTRRIEAGMDRRGFLRGAAAATLPFFWSGASLLADDPPAGPQLISRETNPNNFESPFAALDKPITPNELFYVRNHFAQPRVDKADWRLKVTGAVEKPLELTYDQLLDLPSVTRTVTLECAGTGRSFLTPKAKGVQWELGAVSTAEWTGVPLSKVLEKAGLRSDAVEVVLEGVDKGESKNDAKPAGALQFARSLPIAKAQKPEVILAYKMNGAVLPEAHGFPLRAIVGGWYGMASVKWLTQIIAADRPFDGFFQGVEYGYWDRRYGLPTLKPITEMDVKASIAQPQAGATVAANATVRVHGAAWAGESEPAKVEVSTDGGKKWEEAVLLGTGAPAVWRLWEYNWKTPAAGKHVLMARATDKRGRVQPMERDPDLRNYRIGNVHPTEVVVKDQKQ
jgi:DMSO/TMAO reductase YedYZ molybdopterin-dependent catalytic subunit